MKRFSLIILALVLAFGLALASCDNGTAGGGTDSALNGRWLLFTNGNIHRYYSFTFSNGEYTFRLNGEEGTGYRGMYTTSGNNLTLTTTAFYADSVMAYVTGTTMGWKDKSQLTEIWRQQGYSDAEIDRIFIGEGFSGTKCTYSISDDFLRVDGSTYGGTYIKDR